MVVAGRDGGALVHGSRANPIPKEILKQQAEQLEQQTAEIKRLHAVLGDLMYLGPPAEGERTMEDILADIEKAIGEYEKQNHS